MATSTPTPVPAVAAAPFTIPANITAPYDKTAEVLAKAKAGVLAEFYGYAGSDSDPEVPDEATMKSTFPAWVDSIIQQDILDISGPERKWAVITGLIPHRLSVDSEETANVESKYDTSFPTVIAARAATRQDSTMIEICHGLGEALNVAGTIRSGTETLSLDDESLFTKLFCAMVVVKHILLARADLEGWEIPSKLMEFVQDGRHAYKIDPELLGRPFPSKSPAFAPRTWEAAPVFDLNASRGCGDPNCLGCSDDPFGLMFSSVLRAMFNGGGDLPGGVTMFGGGPRLFGFDENDDEREDDEDEEMDEGEQVKDEEMEDEEEEGEESDEDEDAAHKQ